MNPILTARYLTTMRFAVFQHVPDADKQILFHTLIRVPFQDEALQQAINANMNTNQYQQIIKLVKVLKKVNRLLSFGAKDLPQILAIFWQESNPSLACRILATLLGWNADEQESRLLEQIVQNLLFSARCPQDKEAALCILQK